MAEQVKANPVALIKIALEKALETQYPIAVENVARLHRVHPNESPGELISYMNKVYLAVVTGSGVSAGAGAAARDKRVRVAVAIADPLMFLEASILYTLSVAEIHGLDFKDVERRRLLVMSAVVGNRAANATLKPLLDRSVPYWGRQIVKAIPMSAINKANAALGPRFVTKYGMVQGSLVLGKQVPRFIGAGIGAGGNALFGWFIINAARRLLGPPPESWYEFSERA